MCEDRSIETYGQLQALLNGENIYKRLHFLYRIADEKYNSGLFHFAEEKGRAEAPDKLTLGLKIDDRILKHIIRRLYYPESPYEFSVLGADVLGNVYEQFLGKVIRGIYIRSARVRDTPIRQCLGVYRPGLFRWEACQWVLLFCELANRDGSSPRSRTRRGPSPYG